MTVKLYNTLSRKLEDFNPIQPGKVGMYCCGPTVYNYMHIGNLRTYVNEDLLRRMFLYNGYEVKQVMNITDVGHLTSDEDVGEDKMEVSAQREGRSVWDIANFYTEEFKKDFQRLNILNPDVYCKATDHIPEQIELVKCLEKKGFTYLTSDGVYFDTSKMRNYGELARLDVEGLKGGSRIELGEKRNKTDFALWKFSPRDSKRQMQWESPWGVGFPGWHIECSAMAMKYLGNHFDIHCGGTDHIPVHHTNEIAQSESCTGEKFVNYWFHGEFLVIGEEAKMSKSKENFIRLQTLIDWGYDPMDYRYLCLGTHYRKRLQFSREILDQAKNAFTRLKTRIVEFKSDKSDKSDTSDKSDKFDKFRNAINDDLNIPEALAVLWEVIRDESLSPANRLATAYEFDKVLALGLKEVEETKTEVPEEIVKLVEERNEARKRKDFQAADEIRKRVKEMGYELIDKKDGIEIKRT
jgi:cysteinyl-tRNA synthetase